MEALPITLEDFSQRKKSMIRLRGCIVYKDGKRLEGGYAVYVQKAGDKEGLAIIHSAVTRVQLLQNDPALSSWGVINEDQAISA